MYVSEHSMYVWRFNVMANRLVVLFCFQYSGNRRGCPSGVRCRGVIWHFFHYSLKIKHTLNAAHHDGAGTLSRRRLPSCRVVVFYDAVVQCTEGSSRCLLHVFIAFAYCDTGIGAYSG